MIQVINKVSGVQNTKKKKNANETTDVGKKEK